MTIKIRIAKEEDIEVINNIYKSIDFKESIFINEKIIIAECDNEIVGLGRVQKIDENSAELGGLYVNKNHRGKGIERKIMFSLIEYSSEYDNVYCIPFKHLEKFYRCFGFKDIETIESIPEVVKEKHKWCHEFYEEETLLLVRDKLEKTDGAFNVALMIVFSCIAFAFGLVFKNMIYSVLLIGLGFFVSRKKSERSKG